jgi:hypothetical protein
LTPHQGRYATENANRKSSAHNSTADALLKKANKNQLAHMAILADMADQQKADVFHQKDAGRPGNDEVDCFLTG